MKTGGEAGVKMRRILGSVLFFIGLIAFWQLLYVAATDWMEWAKPYAVRIRQALYRAQERCLQTVRCLRRLEKVCCGFWLDF